MCEVPISFIKATLGGEIEVPTLEGNIKYTIQEGTQPGTIVKIRSKGIPRINSSGRGDLYAQLNVEIPKKLNDRQRELLKRLAVEFGEDVSEAGKKTFRDKFKDAFN